MTKINNVDEHIATLALENIVRDIPGHLYWKDRNGIYKGCNDRQAKSLGMNDASDVIGKTDFELPWPQSAAKQFWENDQAIIRSGKSVVFEEMSLVDGKKAIVLSHKTPLINHNGAIEGILGISIDISKQKAAEEKLVAEVEESEKLKTAFIENMEHDIRTPISGIYGVIELLFEIEADIEKRNILNMARAASQELLDYCNGLLGFTRIQSGTPPVTEQPIKLQQLIDGIFLLEQPVAMRKNITLTHKISEQLPYVILGDFFRLKRILLNLIGNALKFTQIGSVTVNFEPVLPIKNRHFILSISVTDTGIGIPEDKQNLIYQKYAKIVPSNKGIYKGVGLGLSIVRQFVGELEGEIQLESELGKGTNFIVLIPVKQSLSAGLD